MATIQKRKTLQGTVLPPHTAEDKELKVGDTDSIKLKLENNVLTGEVDWKSQLGYTADKAYPGNDGVKNRNSIEAISLDVEKTEQDIRVLRSNLQDFSSSTNKQLKNISQTLDTFKNLVTTDDLLEQVSKEALRALTAEKDLLDKITKEVVTREDVDQDLKNELKLISNDFDNQFLELVEKIDKETKSIKEDIKLVTEDLEAEKKRALSSESSLRYKLSEQKDEVEKQFKELNDKFEEESSEVSSRFQNIENLLSSYSKNIETIFSTLNKQDSNITKKYRELSAKIVELNRQLSNLYDYTTHVFHYYEELRNEYDAFEVTTEEELEVLNTKIESEVTRSKQQDNELLAIIENLDQQFLDLKTSTIQKVNELTQLTSSFEHQVHSLREAFNEFSTTIDLNIKDFEKELTQSFENLKSSVTETLESFEQSIANLETSTEEKLQDLQDQITPQDSIVTKQPNEGIDQLYGQYGEVTKMYNISSQPDNNTVVQRDDSGNILVPTTGLTDSSAVPKQVVDNLLAELEEKLKDTIDEKLDLLQFDFIDGGTAPLNE